MTPLKAHYCHPCGAAQGLFYSLPADPLRTSYQLEKYTKHLVPDPKYSQLGVFTSTEARVYKEYIVNAQAAGGVIVDDRNRFNIVLCAGKEIGYEYRHGQVVAPTDAFQLVLSSDAGKFHAYPIQSAPVVGLVCSTPGCDRPALVV